MTPDDFREYYFGRLPKTYGTLKRKRRIRRSVIWWERFGVIVSTVATILAAAAVFSSVWQASIMKDQNMTTNRNAEFISVLNNVDKMCEEIYKIGAPRDIDENGRYLVTRSEAEDLTGKRKLFLEVRRKKSILMDSLRGYAIWARLGDDEAIAKLRGEINSQVWGLTEMPAAPREFAIGVYAGTYMCDKLADQLIQWFRYGTPISFYSKVFTAAPDLR